MIGNPPYVVVKKGLYPKYKWNTDLYTIFFEITFMSFLQKNGVVAFITPRFFLFNQNCFVLRKFLIDNVDILSMTECSPFDAITENEISVIKKRKPTSKFIRFFKYENQNILFYNRIKKLWTLANKYLEINPSQTEIEYKLLTKIEENKKVLSEIVDTKRGAEIGKKDLRKTILGTPILLGYDVDRFQLKHTGAKIDTNHKEYKRLNSFFNADQLVLLRRVSKNIVATVTNEKTAFSKNLYGLISTQISLPYLCALLNSNVLNFYYKKKFST